MVQRLLQSRLIKETRQFRLRPCDDGHLFIMKQYLIFNSFDFKFQQTDNKEEAENFGICEDFLVVDLHTGKYVGLDKDKEVEQLS